MESKETKNEALKSRTGQIQLGAENISANHAPGLEEIRLRALSAAPFRAMSLKIGCKPNVN